MLLRKLQDTFYDIYESFLIGAELSSLEATPPPPGCKKLKAREGYRIRVGDYRIVYSIDDAPRPVRILVVPL
jgi:mRNA-degrading endonuclease RelE of RelBE toxin-antitoxin system